MGVGTIRISGLLLLHLLSAGAHSFRVAREGIPADVAVVKIETDEPSLSVGIITITFYGPSVEDGREYQPVLETTETRVCERTRGVVKRT